MTQRRSTRSSSDRSPGSRWLVVGVLAAIAIGVAVLLTTLLQQCAATADAIDVYVASIAAGAAVSASVGADEAATLTRLLRTTTSVSVDDARGQWGTACYGTRIEHASGSTAARFLLEEHGDAMRVVGASLRRQCICPDTDLQEPCRLE